MLDFGIPGGTFVHRENTPSPSEGAPSQEHSSAMDEVSRQIQRGLLPAETPRVPGFDLAAGTRLGHQGPGRTLWDLFDLRSGRSGLVNLNVQGDGMPPGLFLALSRALLRELGQDQEDLQGLLARLNSGLAAASIQGVDQYVEAGVLLPTEEGVEWAGAGSCPGGVIRRNGVFQEFSTHGPPLGMMEGFLYGTERVELGAGDSVLVLSHVPQGVFRGAADLVSSLQGKPAGQVVATLHKALGKAQPESDFEASVLFVRKQ